MIAVGLMSGTSLDGIDAALVRLEPRERSYAIELLAFETYAFEAELARSLRDALPPNAGSVEGAAHLHAALGRAFAAAARAVAGNAHVDFVASHGQTVWHDGPQHVTLQLGDAFAIREAMRATVCYDFRSADCAAGGHGAPLVPYVDRLLFGDDREDRVALNLGGIANVTLLPAGGRVWAFDTGPANINIDAFVAERTGGSQRCDTDGALAARGRVVDEILEAMLADPYFALTPPKTTGREYFGAPFLRRFAQHLSNVTLEDGAATLTELTAATVAHAVDSANLDAPRLLAGGGGAHNPTLLGRIAARLPKVRVETTDAAGVPVDAKEAIAFAILGYETLRGRPSNVPGATGAPRAVPLGAIAPYDLSELLERMDGECRNASS
ncbi:MAG TPA: anhydro-N-acetylmuramic acid kinase [Candidatus Acidoferrales bacterium]|nr:anhydro-N-acetylmuramic acid kinase [Candidatus Acidoferrales bacterium]